MPMAATRNSATTISGMASSTSLVRVKNSSSQPRRRALRTPTAVPVTAVSTVARAAIVNENWPPSSSRLERVPAQVVRAEPVGGIGRGQPGAEVLFRGRIGRYPGGQSD